MLIIYHKYVKFESSYKEKELVSYFTITNSKIKKYKLLFIDPP